MAAGDCFFPAAQRGDQHRIPLFRVSFSRRSPAATLLKIMQVYFWIWWHVHGGPSRWRGHKVMSCWLVLLKLEVIATCRWISAALRYTRITHPSSGGVRIVSGFSDWPMIKLRHMYRDVFWTLPWWPRINRSRITGEDCAKPSSPANSVILLLITP
jgi:hypothetical protein